MSLLHKLGTVAVLAMVLGGCAERHEHSEHSKEHDHEEFVEMVSYDSNTEMYILSKPLVVNEETEFHCFLTQLTNFKPYTEGAVKVILSVDSTDYVAVCEHPERPGVYHMAIKPEKAGYAKLKALFYGPQDNAAFKFEETCYVFPSEEEADKYMEEHESDIANAVAFPKSLSWSVDFSTENVSKRPMGHIVDAVAQILPSQGDEMTVVAKTDGVVSFFDKLDEGRAISLGQSLCSIDASATVSNNLASQQAQAKTELQRAKTEYERLEMLYKDRLVLASEVNAAKATYEQAQNNYDVLSRNSSGGRQTISAPKAGYLKQLLVTNGQFVVAGQPLAVITQSKTLRLKANVQSRYYSDLKNINGATIRKIDVDDSKIWRLSDVGGRLVSYGRQTEEGSSLVPVIFEVNNVFDMPPGSYLHMHIKTGQGNDVLTVPAVSIMEDMGNFFVYVQISPASFEKRQVKIGVTDGLYTEIKSGLTLGERVVARGAMLVKMQQATGAVDPHAGHSH